MLKVLYVHGYLGSANGSTTQLLQKILNENNIDAKVDAPPISVLNPDKAVRFIMNEANNYDIIVASSLGAFYAMQVSGPIKILINPGDPTDLKILNPDINLAILERLNMQKRRYVNIWWDFELKSETYIIFGKQDNIATHNKWLTDFNYPLHIYELDNLEHKANEESIQLVVNIIKEIYNK